MLKYFLAVASEENISAAAERLNISQPALSMQIKSLENEIGKQLVIRGVKGSQRTVLTEEGIILKRRAEEICELVKKTEKEIQSQDKEVSGDIYIGAGESYILRYFAYAAKELNGKYPDVHFHISSGNGDFVIEQLDKGLIDFGLVYGKIDRSRYDVRELPVKDVFGVLMRADSPLAEKKTIAPDDIADKPLIISRQEERDGWPVLSRLKKNPYELNIRATYNLIYNASLMVEAGLGYAVCFNGLINTSGDSALCFRPIEPNIYAAPYIIWKRYQVLTRASMAYLRCLENVFSDFQNSIWTE